MQLNSHSVVFSILNSEVGVELRDQIKLYYKRKHESPEGIKPG